MRWADAAWECAGWDQANLLSVLIVCEGAQDPSMPPPPPLKHSIIMLQNTAACTFCIIIFMSHLQNSFFLQRPTLCFLCTLQSPLTLHQTHSNLLFYFRRLSLPQTRNSAALLFLNVPPWSYLSSLHGLWQSRCNVPGVLLIVQLCLLFWSCWLFFVFGLYFVCSFSWSLSAPSSHYSLKKKTIYHLLLIYVSLEKPKLVPHICSHWAGAMRRPDSVTAGRQNQSEGVGLKHFRDLLVWISRIWVNLWVCSALLVYSELWSLVEPNSGWLCQAEAEFSACHCF